MERIVFFACVLTIIVSTVNCQDELAIDFKIVRPDNTSSLVSNDQVSANSASNDRLQIICRKSNIPNMVDYSVINLYRITQNGEPWIATMQTRLTTSNGFKTPYLVSSVTAGMQVVGGHSDTDPTLGISLPVNTLNCNDQHSYKCMLTYGYTEGSSYKPGDAHVNKNLTVTVLPSRIALKAYNMSSSSPMNEIPENIGNDPTLLAQFKIGQEIKLTCKALLGTHNNGAISWRKSNIVAQPGSGLANLAPYIPNAGEHEVGQLVTTGCQFEKTDSITYNMTDQDSTRTTSNPLQFQCYISAPSLPSTGTLPETTVQNFFIKVSNVNEPTTGGLATAGSTTNVAPIIGGVIGGLVGLILIVVIVLIWKHRRGPEGMCPGGESYTTKEEQGASNPNLAPEQPQYAQSTKKGQENRAMDERTESSHARYANDTYDRNDKKDRNDRKDRNGQRGGGRKNHAMDHSDDEDYHSRDGSTHMGLDPEHGGIGTGV